MIFYSFTNWDGYSPNFEFVGIDNYTKLFSEDNIAPIAVAVYYLTSSGLQLLLGIFLAVYVYFQKRFKPITIIIILLPVLLNTVAVGLMFGLFFTPGGTFDMFLNWTHIIPYLGGRESVKWIGDSDIVIIYLFRDSIRKLSTNIDASARVMGASYYQIYWRIILPSLKPTIMIVSIYKLINIYNDFYFQSLYLTTKKTISTFLYKFTSPYEMLWPQICATIVVLLVVAILALAILALIICSGLTIGFGLITLIAS